MGLEGRSFRHHGTDDKPFDVLRLHPADRIKARLARLPDEVAVARLAYAELRDPRPDQRDASHAGLLQIPSPTLEVLRVTSSRLHRPSFISVVGAPSRPPAPDGRAVSPPRLMRRP